MSFIDYTKLVLRYYEQKKAKGKLPLNLSVPTPARLRDECLIAYKRLQRKDEKVLRDFFGAPGIDNTYLRIIANFDINRFKPLLNFLKKPTIKTDEKNVELLAWLIDFQPRPNEYGRRYDTEENANGIPAEAEEDSLQDTAPGEHQRPQPEMATPQTGQPGQIAEIGNRSLSLVHKLPQLKKTLTYIMLVIVVVATVLFYKGKTGGNSETIMGASIPTSGHCMYWAGDYYEPTPCTPKRGDTLLVELDSAKLFRFKRIAHPETITKDDIGRVAYVKLDGRIEYYTDTGFHPVYTHKRLKPLTKFMFDKYIHSSAGALSE